LVPYIIFLLITLIMAVIHPGTLGMRWMANKSDAAFSLVLVSVGQTFPLITGGFDLSVGGIICVTNSILAVYMGDSAAGIILWTVICVLIGAGIGVFNGFVIAKTNIQPFIVTLATQSACLGTALLILKIDGGRVAGSFISVLLFRIAGFPVSIFLIALIVIWWLYVKHTKCGMALYAIGSDEKAAHLNGISLLKTKVLAYGISGSFAALAGIFRTAHVASGSPTAGASFVMTSISAAVIGGTAITGGSGGVIGSIVGAFIIRSITDLLVFMRVSSYWTLLVQGLLLVFAVALTSYAKLRRKGTVAQ
jgi:ribose transport system permease protein